MRDKLPTRFGRYDLLERLSAGRMAEVYIGCVAGAAGVDKIVAIKRILNVLCGDDNFVRAFIKEARISTSLAHPNVGQVYEFGEVSGQYYLAMEYVHGRDLMAILEHFRRIGQTIPLPVAIRIVLEVCKALDYAHNKRDSAGRALGLVHRDVSPTNILISFEGAVKLIDFGLAKALVSRDATVTGPLRAKCAYISPEQATGQPIDRRSDLFALGTVLYEMVAGKPLFLAGNDTATLAKLRRCDVPAPSKINPKLPPALEAIILKMLAREPARRYQYADIVHDVLERVASDESLSMSTLQLGRWMTGTFPLDDSTERVAATTEEITLTAPPGAEKLPERKEATTNEVLLSLGLINQSLENATSFAAARPPLGEKDVDFAALDLTPPGAEAPLPVDPDLPGTSGDTRTRPSAMPLWDDAPTSPMASEPPGLESLTTNPVDRSLQRTETKELVSRSSGGQQDSSSSGAEAGISFEPGPLEEQLAQEVLDLPYKETVKLPAIPDDAEETGPKR